jgi:hypothetical protein
MLAGRDNMGQGPANILVPPTCAGSVLGTLCGAVTGGSMITAAMLPNITVQAGSTLGVATGVTATDSGHSHTATVNDPGHTHTYTAYQLAGGPNIAAGTAGINNSTGTTSSSGAGVSVTIANGTANISASLNSGGVGGTLVPRTGAQQALTAPLPPLTIINKMIKY